jgi:hypothetical protein
MARLHVAKLSQQVQVLQLVMIEVSRDVDRFRSHDHYHVAQEQELGYNADKPAQRVPALDEKSLTILL